MILTLRSVSAICVSAQLLRGCSVLALAPLAPCACRGITARTGGIRSNAADRIAPQHSSDHWRRLGRSAGPRGHEDGGREFKASAGRAVWIRSARASDEDSEDETPNLPGSGLRGVDTSYLEGNVKRDADWFQRTAEREAKGQLAWFEDPVIYIALVGLVPVFILAWGVLNCYIPGFCENF